MKFISTISVASAVSANPIRKVVTMLQNIENDLEKESDKEDDMHAKFSCYCKTNNGELSATIQEAKDEIPVVEAHIKQATSSKSATESELAQHKEDRTSAKASIAAATEQRKKEFDAYSKLHNETTGEIEQLTTAVKALESGMGKSFLQSSNNLKSIVNKSNIDEDDKNVIKSFLEQPSESYSSQSGEIVGILKTMLEEYSKDDVNAVKDEQDAVASFKDLLQAKNKEIAAAGESIEAKTTRVGTLAVEIVNTKNDLKNINNSLNEDEQFKLELSKSCDTADKDHEARVKSRSEEQIAIAETIKVLNDDDALELFTKAVPSALLQVEGSASQRVKKVQGIISNMQDTYQSEMSFISLALKGKGGFAKVLKMIDDMVVTLKKEQVDDNKHGEWCNTEFDTSDDKKQAAVRKITSLEQAIDQENEGIATLKDEIKSLESTVAKLDNSVTIATAQRKQENADFIQSSAENNAALKVIDFAKNRLNKFYNPAQYKAPEPRKLTEEERIFQANGGELEPVPVTGIAGTGIAIGGFFQISKVAPPPAPAQATYGKSEKSSGVIGMINLLVADLKKEGTVIEEEEKDAQEDYEKLMSISQKKRTADTKTILSKNGNKADLEIELSSNKGSKQDSEADLMAVNKYISELHSSCDFIQSNFDFRKEARTQEIDALVRSKAVLAGSDYSFLQRRSIVN